MAYLALVLTLAGLLEGCAAIQGAPRNIANSWTDPARREHTLARIGEGIVGAGAAIGAYEFCRRQSGRIWVGIVCGAVGGVLAEYLFFEFVLEPAGVTGAYWERGSNRRQGYRRP